MRRIVAKLDGDGTEFEPAGEDAIALGRHQQRGAMLGSGAQPVIQILPTRAQARRIGQVPFALDE